MPFWFPGSFAGFFGAGGGGGGAAPSPSTSGIDPLVQTDTLDVSQVVFGFDKLHYNYSGATTRWVRTSDSAQADFGVDDNWRFDKAALVAWAGASPAYPVKFYAQMGTGDDLVLNVNGGTVDCYDGTGFLSVPSITDWDDGDGTLALNRVSSGNKCIVVSILGGAYYECAASGLGVTNDLEFHVLCGMLDDRKAANDASFPVVGALSSEQWLFSYGSNSNGLRYGTNVGNNLFTFQRTASLQTSTSSAWYAKKNAMALFSLRNTDSAMNVYQYGGRLFNTTPNATNITQNANLGNKAIRIGRANSGYASEATAPGRLWFSALMVTDALADNDPLRGTIQSRLKAVAQQHALISVSSILSLLGPTGALVDFRDWDDGTGLIEDRKGNLSYQFNIASGSPDWTANSATPGFGFPGVLATGDTLDNRFRATSTYYGDRYSGTVFTLNYRTVGGDLAQDWADGIDDEDGHPSFNQNDGWSLGLGWHHSQPNLYIKWSDTYQLASPDATAHTYPDQGGDNWDVQAMLKYLFNVAHGDWQDPITPNADITCTNFYTGATTTFTSGSNVTTAQVEAALGIKPPTPEQRAYPTVPTPLKYKADDSTLQFHCVTFEAPEDFDPTKTEAQNGAAVVKSATNWSYVSTCGFGIGHQNSSIANQIGNGNVRRADPTARIQTMPYLSMFQGVRLIHGFSDYVLTSAQVEQIDVSLYRIFTNGYESPTVLGTSTGLAIGTPDGKVISIGA